MIAPTQSEANTIGEPSVPKQPKGGERILGLDSLRFILAFWVVLSHFGNFPLKTLWAKPFQSQAFTGLWNTSFIGVSAVVAFFLISGFCIHLPYYRGKPLKLRSYFLRREIRILLPVVAAFAIATAIQNFKFTGVLWSLVCEEVYYCLYPAMLSLRKKQGSWTPLLVASVVLAAVVIVYFGYVVNSHLDPDKRRYDFQAAGYMWTWAAGLPMWLLGCVLAEKAGGIKPWDKPKIAMWAFRLGVWGVTMGLGLIRFHGPSRFGNISYMYTLPLFSILVFYWLSAELAYAKKYPPSKLLESLGMASFTLYLTHMLAVGLMGVNVDRIEAPVTWILAMLAVGALAAAFYYVIEKPSHALAKRVGDRLDGKVAGGKSQA